MTAGRILLADDDESFRRTTADLLRRDGYEVDEVPDADAALYRIQGAAYDLLISDLEMPGNEGLALVRELARMSGGLPVIIVTGYPTFDSALASIELPVCAYLVKPLDPPTLSRHVRSAVSRFRGYQAMRQAEQRLAGWSEDMQRMRRSREEAAVPGEGSDVDAFLSLTLRNVMGSLADLERLGQALAGRTPKAEPCQLMDCPRGAQLQAAVRETIDVLEETKSAFKSKTLADLRQRLELLLVHG